MRRFIAYLAVSVVFAGCRGDTAPDREPATAIVPTAEVTQRSAGSTAANLENVSPPPSDAAESSRTRPAESGPTPREPPVVVADQTEPGVAPESGVTPDEGAAILQRAASAYTRVSSMRANFVMRYENALTKQTTTSRGTISQRKPDRIAVRFTEPAGDVIVGDGQYFWVYYASVDAKQVMRSPVSAAGEQAVDLQSQFVGNPVERFRYTLHGTESVGGRPASVLTLVPRERAQYRALKVWLDASDSLARRFEITELNGVVRRFDLSGLEVNTSIPDAVFRFSVPAGATVVPIG